METTLEQAVQELRLAEQALMREALEMKAARLAELESEITYLRRTLNEVLSVPRSAPAAAPAPARPRTGGGVPRRWVA